MFASDDSPATAFETPFNRGQINIADVFSQLILSPLRSSSVEMVVSAVAASTFQGRPRTVQGHVVSK